MSVKRMTVALACVLALGVTTVAAQDRGRTKAEGRVVDEQGQPLEGAIVAAVMEGFDKPFQQAKTNRRGEWSIDNLAAGNWKFYIGGIQGLEETGVDVEVPASGTAKVPDVKLGKPVDHQAYVNSELQRAQEMMQTRQPAEARKIYEEILGKYGEKLPDDFRGQLHGAVAQTYAMQEQPAQAVEHLRQAVKLDPDNTDIHLVYGEMLVQTGQRAEGEKVLLAQDISKVKDPYPYMNIVIAMINEKRTQESIDLLNRLIKQFPQEATLYYYRGRAHVAAEKFQEGRADLEKFVATAPADAREMEEAKSILGQLKDVK